MQKILELKEITAAYGDIQVLWGINLEVYDNEIVSVLGSNGAGKTTMMRIIAGLHRVWDGEVIYMGKGLKRGVAVGPVKYGISMVPEGRQLFPGMTVYENLKMGAFIRRDQDKIKQDLDWVTSLFPILEDRKNQLAGKLSGGEQQMCAIGRALMADPKLLMIDEMSLGLAPVVIEKIIEALVRIRDKGTTILIVEQDVNAALEVSDRGYVIENGKLVLSGNACDLINNDMIKSAYMGI